MDHSLDAAEAQRIASGQDTRYGTSRGRSIQEYITFAADWQTALDQITEVCDGTGMPTAAEQAATVQAFTIGDRRPSRGRGARVAPGSTLRPSLG